MKNLALYFCASALLAGQVNASTNQSDPTSEAPAKINENSMTSLTLEASSEAKLGKLLTKMNRGDSVYTLSIEGAIDENKKTGIFADLDGLKDGTKVSFGYSRIFFNENYFKEQSNLLLAKCAPKQLSKILTDAYNKIENCKTNEANAKNSLTYSEGDSRDAYLAGVCKAEIEEEMKIKKDCDDYAAPIATQAVTATKETFWAKIVTFEVAGSNKSHTWADPESLSEFEDDKNSYSAQFQYGFINQDYQRLNLGLRYEKIWKGNDEKNLCSPYESSPTSLVCNSIAIGGPARKEARIIFVEGKTYTGKSAEQAVSVRVSHDFESEVTGIEIPYYFWKDKESGSLQAGVKLGWVSDTKKTKDKKSSDTMLSIFFNKQFNIGY